MNVMFDDDDYEPEPSPAELEAADRYARRTYAAISAEDARLAAMVAGTFVVTHID
jgi:hypothetical protein